MCNELKASKHYFSNGTSIETIYFGGGTPSVLKASEIDLLMNCIAQNFDTSKLVEVTFEANPDDLDESFLKVLKSLNINRLSIGIQSLNDAILQWMNRSHNSKQAADSVRLAAEKGFESINIDLIYGVPGLSDTMWKQQLDQIFTWPIDHLSAYSLTLEEKTAYANYVKKGSYLPPSDEAALSHYRALQVNMPEDWKQYEVSNYCKGEATSKHNSAYWNGAEYLGIGPSAHGFDTKSRYWNVASNAAYVQADGMPKSVRTVEDLSEEDKFNELIMTRLRTRKGLDIEYVKSSYNIDLLSVHHTAISEWRDLEYLQLDGNMMRLTAEGLLFSDTICSELFIDHSSQMSL